MAFFYECSAVTHIGTRRKNHEDNFYIGEMLTSLEQASLSQTGPRSVRKSIAADNGRNRIFAVSDGMGGHKNGEAASCMAVEALRHFSDADTAKALRRRQDKYAYIQSFQDMIRQTNRRMLEYSEGEKETDCMGATLSGMILFSDEIVTFNIGDSSVFLFENEMLRKLTVDDNEAVWSGVRREGLTESKGRRLTKYFGLPEVNGVLTAAIPDPIPLRDGQVFLISSDGLTDSLSVGDICRILEGCQEDVGKAADLLVENALWAENGGRDNITAVVLKIRKMSSERQTGICASIGRIFTKSKGDYYD
ncbi:hypothetical protein C808_04982 [Lachnospiraceae bacterium M18-1]|nr:hypothetical protein C808_04982 [Lachnospiraceae bacterium M18-1]